MKRHVVLLGLPGAGKSTVGRLAADALGAAFADVDRIVADRAGSSIAAIFAAQGESRFRDLERAEMRRLLDGPPAVLAPGGGWGAWGDNLTLARNRALFIYLRTQPAVAAARTAGGEARPLLTAPDRVRSVEDLLAARERYYASADATVETGDRTPEDIAHEVTQLARARAGW